MRAASGWWLPKYIGIGLSGFPEATGAFVGFQKLVVKHVALKQRE